MMTLDASGMLAPCEKLQYLHTLLYGQAISHFDTLCARFRNRTTENFNRVVLGLGTYFITVKSLSEKKRVMLCRMKNPRELKV